MLETTDVGSRSLPLGATRIAVDSAPADGLDPERGNRDLITVTLSGEFDMHTSAQIRERLAALDADGWQRIVIDMSDVTFVDSAGLAVLVAALRRSERRHATLKIESAHPNVRRILDLTHLSTAFGLDRATAQVHRKEGQPWVSEPASS